MRERKPCPVCWTRLPAAASAATGVDLRFSCVEELEEEVEDEDEDEDDEAEEEE